MCAVFQKDKHDIGVLRADASTTCGLMLATKNGVPIYEIVDDEPLAEQRAEGEPGYGWFKPTHELAIIQDEWRGGCGQYIAGATNRYHQSAGVDTRFPNMLIPANKPTAVTKPTHTAPTITNADMETASSGWTEGARDATYAQAGSFSWLVQDKVEAYQDMTGWKAGITYTFTVYVRGNGVTSAGVKIGINDGTTSSYSDETGITGSWVQRTVTYRLPLTATRCRLLMYNIDSAVEGGHAWFDTAALTFTALTVGTTKAMAEYNAFLYASFGTLLAKQNTGGTAFTLVADIGSTITSLAVGFDGFLWIGTEDSTTIEDCEDAWTAQDSDVTCSADTTDYKAGSASNKMVVASTAGVQIIAFENFTATDFSQKTGVRFWFKSSVALTASDWQLLLDNTDGCGSAVETLNLPAISAQTWTHVYLKFAAAASTRTAIQSVGLTQAVDKGAMTVWVDDVKCEQLIWYMSAGDTFTQGSRSDDFAKWFVTNNGASPTLYKFLPPNQMKTNTIPSDSSTAWSSATSVDSPYYSILNVISSQNTVYIKKEDRTFYVDSTGAVKVLVEDTKRFSASAASSAALSWQERIYLAYGTQSLVEYDEDGNVNWRDPSLQMTNVTDIDGQIVGLAADEHYLYAAALGATNIEILAAIYEDVGGSIGWRWHGSLASFAVTTYASLEMLFFSSVYQRRLWICSTTAGANFNYIPIPANYGDPANDGNKSVATDSSNYIITPYYHCNFQADQKSYFELTVRLGSAYSATIYWTASYEKLGDTDWTSIGTFDGTSTARYERKYIPVDSASAKPTSTAIRFKFVPVTNSATTLPVLLSYDCRAKLYPPKKRIINCVLKAADNVQDHQGMSIGSASEIKAVIDEMNVATWPRTFYDLFYKDTGTTKYVDVLSMEEVVITHEREPHRIEKGYRLTLLERTLS